MEDELNVLTNGRHKNGIPTLLNTCIGLVHKDGLYQVLHINTIPYPILYWTKNAEQYQYPILIQYRIKTHNQS